MKFKNFVDTNVNEHKKTEFELYLEDSIFPNHEFFDIFVRWKANQYNYSLLSKITREILTILVPTIASKSVFSATRRVVSTHRNRIHPKIMKALICS